MRFSADGVAVIVHDETLDRLFGLPRRVSELLATELTGIGVPTLVEALAAMPATTLIDLELKEEPTDSLFTTLFTARGPEADGVVVSSFYPGVLRTVEERAPSWSRWLNAETAIEAEQAATLGCDGLSVTIDLLNDANISRWREAGLEVAAWTLRGVEGVAWANDLRLTALCAEGEGAKGRRPLARRGSSVRSSEREAARGERALQVGHSPACMGRGCQCGSSTPSQRGSRQCR